MYLAVLLQDGKTPLSLHCVTCSSTFLFQIMMAVLLLAYDSFSACSGLSAITSVVSHSDRTQLPRSRFVMSAQESPPLEIFCTHLAATHFQTLKHIYPLSLSCLKFPHPSTHSTICTETPRRKQRNFTLSLPELSLSTGKAWRVFPSCSPSRHKDKRIDLLRAHFKHAVLKA